MNHHRRWNDRSFNPLKLMFGLALILFIVGIWTAFFTWLGWVDGDYKIANGLIALAITLFLLETVITGYLDHAEKKRRRRNPPSPNNGPSGTPILSEEAGHEEEGKRLRRTQELMNLDDFGIQLPPHGGRR